jgi:hypothetical protein
MIEVYQFNDNGIYYNFSPYTTEQVVNGVTYIPTMVSRGTIQLTESFAKTSVQFQFEKSHTFAEQMLVNLPEYPVTAIIFRDGNPYWKGQIIGVEKGTNNITIGCDSKYTLLTKNGQQARMGLTCRHTLYSANCGVVQEFHKFTYTVASITSNVFTVPGLAETNGFFNGGIAVIAGQQRSILTQVGTSITLAYPFTGSLSGTIYLYPGCRLTESACLSYNNLDNFGGFSRIPNKNPFAANGLL